MDGPYLNQPEQWSRFVTRFFLPDDMPLRQEFPQTISIPDSDQLHHAVTVMRLKTAEKVTVVHQHQVYAASVLVANKQTLLLNVMGPICAVQESAPQIYLAASVLKEQAWNVLLQKSTELGVHGIQPLISERTVVRLPSSDAENKQQRWQKIVTGAAIQSEGTFVPKMHKPISLTDWFSSYAIQNSARPSGIFLLERDVSGMERPPLMPILSQLLATKPQSITLVLGPEGGWSPTEIELLSGKSAFQSVSLGPRILRAETAAMVVLSAASLLKHQGSDTRQA